MICQRRSSYSRIFFIFARMSFSAFLLGFCFYSQFAWSYSVCSKAQNIQSIDFLKISEISHDILEDPSVIKSTHLVQMLLEERKRLYSPGAWNGKAIQEIVAITGETEYQSKSIYLGVVDRLLEYESQDIIFLAARSFDQKLAPWGVRPQNGFFMQSLLFGFYMVDGHLDLDVG